MKLTLILTFLITGTLSVGAKQTKEVELEPIGNRSELVPRAPVGKPVGFGDSKIVRGHLALPQQYPYHVGLVVGFEDRFDAYCGGTLIDNEWILTAAHCLLIGNSFAKRIEVRLGSVKYDTPLSVSYGYEYHIHPNYDKKKGDIALVKIDWVDYNDNIAPVCLPALNGNKQSLVGARVVATGWGNTDDHGGKSNILKFATMSVIEPQECANAFGDYAKDPSVICTSSKGPGATCSGDSGGPLVLEKNHVLVGVTSFGALGNCEGGLPDGFTKITYYLQWIEDVTGISW